MSINTIEAARKYEQEEGSKVPEELRPKFHLSPRIGWTNDPNGFSVYKGEYHLFYQSFPYGNQWDSMHWGHAVSKDLLKWEYRGTALAPDQVYDSFGCFSGTALETTDGKHLIMYTGVRKDNPQAKDIQTQCIAVGDGTNYSKYENNPVIDMKKIPEGLSPNDFRDPKIWQEKDGSFRCVVGARKPDAEGVLLLFSSKDGFKWEFVSKFIENDGTFGSMWECPDFFELDGKAVVVCSPMDMKAKEFEYYNGHGTLCMLGEVVDNGTHFKPAFDQTVDHGIDFYAPQTVLAPDGRRIMIGWMQHWQTIDDTGAEERKWQGQMTLPRELSIVNNKLVQKPIRELEKYRSNCISYKDVLVTKETSLEGVSGRILDMELEVSPQPDGEYYSFTMQVAKGTGCYTEITYNPRNKIFEVDRAHSGTCKGTIHSRKCKVSSESERLKLRIIMDRYSMEIFVNDGTEVITTLILTGMEANGISFKSDGGVLLNINKYNLFKE